MTDFFICSIKSPQCTDKCSKKNFSIAIFLPRVLMCQKRQISLLVEVKYKTAIQNRAIKNRRLGTIVASIQDSKPRENRFVSHFLIVS